MRKGWVGILIYLTAVNFALAPCAYGEFDKFKGAPSDHIVTDSEALAKQLTTQGENLITKGMKLTGILNAETERDDRGQMNFGVYRTSVWHQGRKLILKISDSEAFSFMRQGNYTVFNGHLWSNGMIDQTSSAFREYLLVHQALADVDAAPALVGVLDYSWMLALSQDSKLGFKELSRIGEFNLTPRGGNVRVVGLLMEEVPDAHALSRKTSPPPFLQSWNEADVSRAIEEIIELRRRLVWTGIYARDEQFVVTRQAHAYLIDLDAYYFDTLKAQENSVEEEIRKLVTDWEISSGKKFNGATLNRFLKRAQERVSPCEKNFVNKGWRRS